MIIIVFNKAKQNREEVENMHRTCRYDLLIYGIIDICVYMYAIYRYMNESSK